MAINVNDMDIRDRAGLRVLLGLLELDAEAVLVASENETKTVYLITEDGVWRVHEDKANAEGSAAHQQIEYEAFGSMESVELTISQGGRGTLEMKDGLSELIGSYTALKSTTVTINRWDSPAWVATGDQLTEPIDSEGAESDNALRNCFRLVRAAAEWGVKVKVDAGA